jgi:hypothetical protein
MPDSFTINDTVLHLIGPGPISAWPKEASFWQARERPELTTGHILSVFSYSKAWDYQERHLDGEELAVVLEGDIEFVLDDGHEERSLRLEQWSGCVIPAGRWHRVVPKTPSTVLFVTPVPAKTDHRRFEPVSTG